MLLYCMHIRELMHLTTPGFNLYPFQFLINNLKSNGEIRVITFYRHFSWASKLVNGLADLVLTSTKRKGKIVALSNQKMFSQNKERIDPPASENYLKKDKSTVFSL